METKLSEKRNPNNPTALPSNNWLRGLSIALLVAAASSFVAIFGDLLNDFTGLRSSTLFNTFWQSFNVLSFYLPILLFAASKALVKPDWFNAFSLLSFGVLPLITLNGISQILLDTPSNLNQWLSEHLSKSASLLGLSAIFTLQTLFLLHPYFRNLLLSLSKQAFRSFRESERYPEEGLEQLDNGPNRRSLDIQAPTVPKMAELDGSDNRPEPNFPHNNKPEPISAANRIHSRFPRKPISPEPIMGQSKPGKPDEKAPEKLTLSAPEFHDFGYQSLYHDDFYYDKPNELTYNQPSNADSSYDLPKPSYDFDALKEDLAKGQLHNQAPQIPMEKQQAQAEIEDEQSPFELPIEPLESIAEPIEDENILQPFSAQLEERKKNAELPQEDLSEPVASNQIQFQEFGEENNDPSTIAEPELKEFEIEELAPTGKPKNSPESTGDGFDLIASMKGDLAKGIIRPPQEQLNQQEPEQKLGQDAQNENPFEFPLESLESMPERLEKSENLESKPPNKQPLAESIRDPGFDVLNTDIENQLNMDESLPAKFEAEHEEELIDPLQLAFDQANLERPPFFDDKRESIKDLNLEQEKRKALDPQEQYSEYLASQKDALRQEKIMLRIQQTDGELVDEDMADELLQREKAIGNWRDEYSQPIALPNNSLDEQPDDEVFDARLEEKDFAAYEGDLNDGLSEETTIEAEEELSNFTETNIKPERHNIENTVDTENQEEEHSGSIQGIALASKSIPSMVNFSNHDKNAIALSQWLATDLVTALRNREDTPQLPSEETAEIANGQPVILPYDEGQENNFNTEHDLEQPNSIEFDDSPNVENIIDKPFDSLQNRSNELNEEQSIADKNLNNNFEPFEPNAASDTENPFDSNIEPAETKRGWRPEFGEAFNTPIAEFSMAEATEQALREKEERDTLLEEEQAEKLLAPPVPRSWQTYDVPMKELLDYDLAEEQRSAQIDKDTEESGQALLQTLRKFKIEAQMTHILKGPSITEFGILPAPGIKLNRVEQLADNLAMELAARSIRIVAPIPGKKAVGVEIPNRRRTTVSFPALMDSETMSLARNEMQLPIILGKEINGEVQIADLRRMPHLLIAGATGSGKSVCVNVIISSLILSRPPQQLRLLMIDPKIVELKQFNNIPHLLTPVITDAQRALQALQWVSSEMERRYALLDAIGAGNKGIESYNRYIKEKNMATVPLEFIVVIIDEFADLMGLVGKELEGMIARLAAMSRAVGIHLVLATQRPSVDVVTGLIKANFPTRIAFMVASQTDSRTILDQKGAEQLLGQGDMLFSFPGQALIRAQGAYLSEGEAEKISSHIKTLGEPAYLDEIIFEDDEADETHSLESGSDDLFPQAVEIALQAGEISTSFLQRRLSIGYNRAARIIDEMEERGLIGPPQGSKKREVLQSF